MNQFAELAKIVTMYKSKKKDILYTDTVSGGGKYAKITESLSENPDLDLKQTEKIVGSDHNSSAYRMFRLRLREKLLNTLLISEVELITPYAKTLAILNRNVYCIKILSLISARATAAELADQSLKKAIEFHITDVAIYCCHVLRGHNKHLGNFTEFKRYNELIRTYIEILAAENKSYDYFESFSVETSASGTFIEVPPNVFEQLKELESLKKKYNTYQLGLNYYRLLYDFHFLLKDYKAALKTLNEMTRFLDDFRHMEYNTRIGEILIYKMHVFLYVRDYKSGLECSEKCREIFKPGTNNWFTYNELLFLLSLHTGNYEGAGKILHEVLNTSQFRFQSENTRERWKLFEGYYFILIKAGIAHGYSNSRFRFSSFLNSMTIHSKDKKGYNTSILIVELLYHLLNKEYHVITEKMDAVKRYAKRHFEDDTSFRSHVFLKMLIDTEKYKFEKDVVPIKTQALLGQLEKMQFTYISSLDGIEIVPFTELWKIVFECLD
jgi:tetratricopeptide (TPR) repeat protein